MNTRVGAEILPRTAKIFAGRGGMRGLIRQVFLPRPAFWRLFSGSGRDAGSARVALTILHTPNELAQMLNYYVKLS